MRMNTCFLSPWRRRLFVTSVLIATSAIPAAGQATSPSGTVGPRPSSEAAATPMTDAGVAPPGQKLRQSAGQRGKARASPKPVPAGGASGVVGPVPEDVSAEPNIEFEAAGVARPR